MQEDVEISDKDLAKVVGKIVSYNVNSFNYKYIINISLLVIVISLCSR